MRPYRRTIVIWAFLLCASATGAAAKDIDTQVALAIAPPPAAVRPAAPKPAFMQSGLARFYGSEFHGRRTANGDRYDQNLLTAAHCTLPLGTMVRVTNRANGRTVVVRVNDRHACRNGTLIDLSLRAASQIGMVRQGVARVDLTLPRRGEW